ncbi:F-box only protein 43-like [Scleropages formosus]|uniref:F-box only protein 43-like n=1 Tax=Scleropages formosus TaxID=113540 RepID=A0A0N8K0E3_SCLFO|nr:F-box only protein 43 [Scleropages formosus]KPP71897.1 F-box only protein 43-like [Scleropages formosus]
MDRSFNSAALPRSAKNKDRALFRDSGYGEGPRAPKVEAAEAKDDMPKENLSSNLSFDSLGKIRLRDSVRGAGNGAKKESLSFTSWCDTPKISKKDASLRRRLLISKAAVDGKTGNAKTSQSRLVPSSDVPGSKDDDDDDSDGIHDSPDNRLFEALATSTLKAEELALSCRNRRLAFSQVKTSTLKDGHHNFTQPLLFGAQDAGLPADEADLNDSIIYSIPNLLTPELLETPCSGKLLTPTNFQTPMNNLATNLADSLSVLSTPSFTPIGKLDISASEDSGFTSLSLDKSQDSSVDHDGSFQELLQQSASRGKDTPRLAELKRRPMLERQRRLPTLREGGSQSEEELRAPESASRKDKNLLKGQEALRAEEDDELFLEKTPLGATSTKLEDLSLTPALQMVHALCQRSATLLSPWANLQELLNLSEGDEAFRTTMPLEGLIGRKMGLEKLDILAELKSRSLRHILGKILNFLSSEDLYRFGQVSKIWNEIISQDKLTYQRRRSYLKELKMALELGGTIYIPDADSRLNALSRSALRSVQPQSRTPIICTSVSGNSSAKEMKKITHLDSKRDKFLEVAKTLFHDECLRPCPRCQHPAKCHSVRREGVCSQEDCAYQFCTACLCAYHGSKECASGSAKRRSRKEVLPGSTQSKRNLRRL